MRSLLIAIVALMITGCANLEPSADPVVTRAEQTIDSVFTTVDAFIAHNHLNRDIYRDKFPDAHRFAESLRERIEPNNDRRFEAIINTARDTTATYQAARTPGNRAAMDGALDALTDMLNSAVKYQLLVP